MMTDTGRSAFITSADGFRLHARCYGKRNASLPVVCLPGLTRTAADFETLAETLSAGRRVIALDYRGRGLSDYDPNPANYSPPVELADVITAIKVLEAEPAIFIGTSRGGILAMLLAATQPAALAGAVLNDIGPVIERAGLERIKSYVGKLPQPKDFDDAADMLRQLFGAQFPALDRSGWMANARATYKREGDRLVPSYDVNIGRTFEGADLDKLPTLWEQFGALAQKPVMLIRGALSDILSSATVQEMRARHPRLETVEVAQQGHAPFLSEPDLICRIGDFVERIG
jgi:pimeloyl-ACP methyl ester carboxylesterase